MSSVLKSIVPTGSNRDIVTNSFSLIFTTAMNSALGFFYWWLAARCFPVEAVGFASTVISAMTLIGTFGMLGLGTLLIGELPRRTHKAGNLIATALLASGLVSGVMGVLFALAAYHLSADLAPLSANAYNIFVFATGVVLTAVTLVVDQAFIGLLRGGLQLRRNIYFSAAKLIALLGVSVWLVDRSGMIIYATWAIGNVVSIVAVVTLLALRSIRFFYRPDRDIIGVISRAALEHHALNLALLTPGLVLPVIVTVMLSVKLTASFYAAWMVAGLGFAIPGALTTVLFAVVSGNPSELASKTSLTLILSFAAGCLASGVLFIGAHQLLSLFGAVYAEQADQCLRILGLAILPMIIKAHYAAICRIRGRVMRAARVMALGSVLELCLAAMGAQIGGLTGIGAGWVAAVCIETFFMAMAVRKAVITVDVSVSPGTQR